MNTSKKLYTKKELAKIRKHLGKDGLARVCELLGKEVETVRIVLVDPNRYQEKVFDTVALVLEEKKSRLIEQKTRIKGAIAV